MPRKKNSLFSLKNIFTAFFVLMVLLFPTQTQKVINWGMKQWGEWRTKKVERKLERLQENLADPAPRTEST